MSGSVRALGAFVGGLSKETIPPDVYEKARAALVHNLSVAAAAGDLADVAHRWSRSRWGGTGSHALVSGLELAPPDAAFVNGCLIHARAQDDVFFPGLTHVGAATIPAALALAEARDASLGDLLVAIVAGYEVAAAVSVLAAPVTTGHGFRASGIYGVFGSAAAGAKLLGLDPEETAHALAIATSFAAGTNQTWVDGSLEWQFQLAAAARNGLEAAMLAAQGGTGADGAFEGASGFFASFARDAATAQLLGSELGRTWHTREVTFKPYPVCAILQAPVEAAAKLHAVLKDKPFERARIQLAPAEAHYPGTEGSPPFDDPGSALMSARYCLAVALTRGTVTAQDLLSSDEPVMKELSRRIDVVADEQLEPRHFALEVEYTDGRVERIERDGSGAYNWGRDALEGNIARLAGEVPPGIDLQALVGLAFGDEPSSVADIVSVMTTSKALVA